MLLDILHNRLVFTGELVCHTAARVGAGRSNEPVGTDLPVIKDAQGQPFIPGSSLKGVLRAYVESVVRAVYPDNRKAVCLPVGPDTAWCLRPAEVEALSDTINRDQVIYDRSCWVCQAFGSPWFSSKIQVRDALVTPLSFAQYQVRDGVAIDRDTQTAADRFKYDYEVVPAQTRFAISILADNLTDAQIGMLCAGLRPQVSRTGGGCPGRHPVAYPLSHLRARSGTADALGWQGCVRRFGGSGRWRLCRRRGLRCRDGGSHRLANGRGVSHLGLGRAGVGH